MAQTPNPPDRDDAITERAVSMNARPLGGDVGAGRAINAAFSRNRPSGDAGSGTGGPGRDERGATAMRPGQGEGQEISGQEERIEGPGYPSEDRHDVDPRPGAEDEDDDGYRRNEEAPGLETGDGMLEELMVPPGGDDLGGDRDTDPNLNGGHGIRLQAPEEGPVPIEVEPTDLSIIGHGHEDKAAWNRDRIAHLQEIEAEEATAAPTSETGSGTGLGGAAVAGAAEGWEGGVSSPTLVQGEADFEDELSEEEEVLGDIGMDDLPEDVLDDESIADPNNTPFLPEHRDLPDEDIPLEERLVATPGEDVLSAGAELGVVEELEAEDLNQTDSISRTYEDTREFMDDAMDGNERRGGLEGR